jgi:hypothetical protein
MNYLCGMTIFVNIDSYVSKDILTTFSKKERYTTDHIDQKYINEVAWCLGVWTLIKSLQLSKKIKWSCMINPPV